MSSKHNKRRERRAELLAELDEPLDDLEDDLNAVLSVDGLQREPRPQRSIRSLPTNESVSWCCP